MTAEATMTAESESLIFLVPCLLLCPDTANDICSNIQTRLVTNQNINGVKIRYTIVLK